MAQVAAPAQDRTSTLPAKFVDEARRARRHPRITQFDYLHLRRLRDDLAHALRSVPHQVVDVLDIYCGTRPYDDLLPTGARSVGLDIDERWGTADVISDEFLPFGDDSFDLIMCIEAFYYVPDPEQGVEEIERVLRPGGSVILAVPFVWEYDHTILEHRFTGPELEALFAGWKDVRVIENGGRGVAWATLTGRLLTSLHAALPRRIGKLLGPAFTAAFVVISALGALVERLDRRAPGRTRLPMNLMITARLPG